MLTGGIVVPFANSGDKMVVSSTIGVLVKVVGSETIVSESRRWPILMSGDTAWIGWWLRRRGYRKSELIVFVEDDISCGPSKVISTAVRVAGTVSTAVFSPVAAAGPDEVAPRILAKIPLAG